MSFLMYYHLMTSLRLTISFEELKKTLICLKNLKKNFNI